MELRGSTLDGFAVGVKGGDIGHTNWVFTSGIANGNEHTQQCHCGVNSSPNIFISLRP